MKKILLGALLTLGLFVNAEDQRYANTHVHGINNAKLALSQNQLLVAYDFPIIQLNDDGHEAHDEHDKHEEGGLLGFLENIFGHEEHEEHEEHEKHEEHKDHDEYKHEGGNDNMREIEEKLSEFKDYTEIFNLNAKAQCKLISFKTEIHRASTDSEHKDVELLYEFNCNQVGFLNEIEFSAFKHFDTLNVINFEAIVNNKAISKKLKENDGKVAL